jgi:very-short-patch-repair endonuclease
VARTLLDLAEVLDRHSLARALEKAEALRIFDLRAVEDVLARAGGRRGAPRLRRALDEYQDTVVRSILEEWFIALCEKDGLPRPKVNTWLAAHNVEVDFVWPDHGAIVETDSRAYHGTPRLRAKDRRRDERLAKAGWLVKRYPYARVAHAPGEVAREVVDLLR